MWKWTPSAISAVPMRMRKDKASIFTDGCFETKSLIAPEASIITPMEITTAVIISETRDGSFTMPTAVMTESSEKMMSIIMICTSTAPKL